MRIAFDVSPLSHPRTGIGNYILGSLAGLGRGGRRRARDRRVRPDEPARPAGDPRGAGGVPVELRLRVLPFSHALPHGLEPARTTRRSSGSSGAIDVLHFSDWMYPPQAAGVRATTIHDLVPLRFPEWVTPRTREMHGEKYAHAARTCDVIFTNSEYTAADVVELLGVPTGARPGRSARARRGVRRGRAPRRARRGRTCSVSARSSRARTWRGSSTRGGCSAATSRSRSPAARAGARSRELADRRICAARIRPGRGAAGALPRRRRLRLPVAIRGLRDPDHRGDGLRHTCGGVLASVARRGLRGRRRARRSGRAGGDCGGDPGGDRAPRRARSERARARWSLYVARRRGDVPPRVRGGSCASGLTRARSCRRRRAPHVTCAGCCARSRDDPTSTSWRSRTVAAVASRRYSATRSGIRSGSAARSEGFDVLHCTTLRGPYRSRAPVVLTVHDLAVLRHPDAFRPWHRLTAALRSAGVRRRSGCRHCLRVHEARGRSSCSGSPTSAFASCRTGSSRCSRRLDRRRMATTSSRSGRSSPARTSRAWSRQRRARAWSCAWSGPAGWGGVDVPGLGRTCSRRGAGAALPRRALRRLRVALRGLRAARCWRRWPAEHRS